RRPLRLPPFRRHRRRPRRVTHRHRTRPIPPTWDPPPRTPPPPPKKLLPPPTRPTARTRRTAPMTDGRRRVPSARTRILGWYVLLLAGALATALLLQRALFLRQVEGEVNQDLDQEVEEFAQLVEVGIDPTTGEPFAGDLAAVFTTYLERNVPLEGEAIVTFLDGEPFRGDAGGQVYRESPLLDVWGSVTESTRDTVDTLQGRVTYLAVPLFVEGQQEGVFVVAINGEDRLSRADELVRLGAAVFGSIFVVASAVAWVVAGGVLRPLRLLGETARSISETDLTRRIPAEGDDEIAELARTFNSMLD